MAGHFFQRKGQLQKLCIRLRVFTCCFSVCFQRDHVRHNRLALCYCAGFIQNNRIDAMCNLQRFRRFNQNTLRRTPSGSHHDRRRRCQSEGTRTGNYQHRNRNRKCKLKALTGKQPEDCRQQRYCNDNRHKHTADPVRQLCNRRFGGCRIIHQLNDL